MNGIFMTGTNTDVGKTWVGSQLITELKKQEIPVKVRKPIESGWPSANDISETDAYKLADALGEKDNLDIICPNRFKAALSPDRAAMLEGENITLQQLQNDCLNDVVETDFLYVEGAGGFYSPICDDGLNADLAKLLKLPVLLIVEDSLGCINQTLLNVEAIAKQGLVLQAIVLNKTTQEEYETEMDNFADIQKRVTCEVIACSFNQMPITSIEQLAKAVLAKKQS